MIKSLFKIKHLISNNYLIIYKIIKTKFFPNFEVLPLNIQVLYRSWKLAEIVVKVNIVIHLKYLK